MRKFFSTPEKIDVLIRWLVAVMLIAIAAGVVTFSLSYYSGAQISGRSQSLSYFSSTSTPFQPEAWTPTPFLPVQRDDTVVQVVPQQSEPDRDHTPSLRFHGVNLEVNQQRITIEIIPKRDYLNNGNPIVISFFPGDICNYGDGNACVNNYRTDNGGNVIFLSVHSGLRGEGQDFRHIIEGTGINRARYSLDIVSENLIALEGAKVRITQGDKVVNGFELVGTGRVPADSLQNYFNAPLQDALRMASFDNRTLGDFVDTDIPQIVFETCGWKMPSEPWAPGVSATTASIYLGVIQKTK